MSDTVAWDRVLALVRGCHDFNAGYLSEPEYGIYHHGIDTVIRVLEAARAQGDAPDLSLRVVESLGADVQTLGVRLGEARDRVAELTAERDRLRAWLERIEGGDVPCDDPAILRRWAWEAGMGREVSDAG